MSGWIVLRDLWKDFITCDGKKIEIQGGFRGFKNIPVGKHTVENYGATQEFEIEVGEVQVYVLNSEKKIFTRLLEKDDDFGFHQLAKSGAMDHALKDWPA